MCGRRPSPCLEPPPKLTPAELQQQLNEAFAGVGVPNWRGIPQPPPQPTRELTPEEIQQRCKEVFGNIASRPEPTPSPRRPDPSTPEELQQRLNEAFAGVAIPNARPSPERPAEPPRKLTPEEIQQQLKEAFAPWERLKSHSPPSRSPRRLRSRFRVHQPATGGPSRRRRCDARVKNLFKIGKNGVSVSRGLFCKAWAMENGRCWVHGGASTGPRTPEGKARVVAAMVEGRRKWVERRRAEGKKFPAGRKRGERWVTEPMRERAHAEARRLGAGRFTLDRPLVLALLGSANGCLESKARAKAIIDAQELAAMERDRQAALARIAELRAVLLG
jgi:hypothetical protein